jgi:mannose-6-phosphate isomerase-like protein (cupin superfamily)
MTAKDEAWAPDDSLNDIVDGEYKGVRRLQDAVAQLGLDLQDRIVTSRDPAVEPLVDLLRRPRMPSGFEQWQLPVIVGGERPAFSFITVGEAQAELPEHVHRNDSLFRIVLAGSIFHEGVELTVGDWMIVPAGHSYSFAAGKYGCVVLHTYHAGRFPRATGSP